MLRTLAACMCLIAAPAPWASGQTFPYVAYTQTESATVRSGPSEEFYATDQLPPGHAVEIYRQKGDWCAVRPPEGSFSYVDASTVEATADPQLLKVIGAEATTRVGTKLSDAHNVEYVTLEQGEILQALGTPQTLAKSSKRWYKVTPPSGEFRWIHRDDLGQDQLESSDESEPDALQVPATAQPLAQSESTATIDSNVQPAVHETKEIPLQKLGQSAGSMQTVPIPTADDVTQDESAARAPDDSSKSPAATDKPAAESAWTVVDDKDRPLAAPTASVPGQALTQDSSFQRLATLNLQLSRTVLTPMGEWDLAPLLAQAEQLSGEGSNASLRAQATALKRRITEFDSLQQRHLELSQPDGAKAAAAAQFAGQGWLVPVVTSRADLPHYALTDEKGQIQHFVSSQPGLNLRRYVRKRVGVVGVPGDSSTTKRSHVIASRVVLLDRLK